MNEQLSGLMARLRERAEEHLCMGEGYRAGELIARVEELRKRAASTERLTSATWGWCTYCGLDIVSCAPIEGAQEDDVNKHIFACYAGHFLTGGEITHHPRCKSMLTLNWKACNCRENTPEM